MLTRKIAKIIRGKVTPLQLTFACVLGALIGFMPGLTQGPGLLLALLAVLVVLNANLWIATLAAALSKLLSLLLMPIQFEAGRLLLDGPTSGLFESLINTPVVAWFGLDYYTVTGGLLLGLTVGLALSFVVVALVMGTRRKLAKMEQSSAIAESCLDRSRRGSFCGAASAARARSRSSGSASGGSATRSGPSASRSCCSPACWAASCGSSPRSRSSPA